MKTLTLIEQELRKEYPNKIVSNLKNTNEELYLKLKNYSKEHNTSIKSLLEENDYVYLRKSIIRLYVDDFIELEKAFPDFKIKSFYETNNKLYYKILAHAKSLKVSMKKYLNSLGFEYESRATIENSSEVDDLLKLYPNKEIKNLSSTDNKLYYRIYQNAKKEKLSMNEYLNKLGFTVKTTRTRKTDNVKKVNKEEQKVSKPEKKTKPTSIKKKTSKNTTTKVTKNKRTNSSKKNSETK